MCSKALKNKFQKSIFCQFYTTHPLKNVRIISNTFNHHPVIAPLTAEGRSRNRREYLNLRKFIKKYKYYYYNQNRPFCWVHKHRIVRMELEIVAPKPRGHSKDREKIRRRILTYSFLDFDITVLKTQI